MDALRMQTEPRPEPARWISISQYARLYGVSRPTVYKWLKAGLLETWKVGQCVRVLNRRPRVA
jgi:excisionase family DNA binding protein